MFVGFMSAGIGNQLYDFSFTYIMAKEYNQDMVLVFDYNSTQDMDYIVLDELQISEYTKLLCDKHIGSNWDYLDVLKDFYKDKSIYEVKESDIAIRPDGRLCLQHEEVVSQYDICAFTRHMYEEKYYKRYLNELRSIFKIKQSKTFYQLSREIDDNTVAIHIRQPQVVGNSEMEAYYKAAVVYFERQLPDFKLFIFTDSKEYARTVLGQKENYYYINLMPRGAKRNLEELMLLAQCKYKILSNNSTFSTWSNMLNPCEDKRVILYDRSHSSFHIFLRSLYSKCCHGNIQIQYLSESQVKSLSKHYKNCLLQTDSGDRISRLLEEMESNIEKTTDRQKLLDELYKLNLLTLKSQLLDKDEEIFILNLKCRINQKLDDFEAAEFCMRALWNYNFHNLEFHKQFKELLLQNGKQEDAECEAEAVSILEGHKEQRKIVILLEGYSYGFCSDRMIEIGITLRRMGHNVSFIYSIRRDIPRYASATESFLEQRVYFSDYLDDSTSLLISMYHTEDILRQTSLEEFISFLGEGYEKPIFISKVNIEKVNVKNLVNYEKICLNSLTWYDKAEYKTLKTVQKEMAIRQLESYDRVITSEQDISDGLKKQYDSKLVYFEGIYQREMIKIDKSVRRTVLQAQKINKDTFLLAKICLHSNR